MGSGWAAGRDEASMPGDRCNRIHRRPFDSQTPRSGVLGAGVGALSAETGCCSWRQNVQVARGDLNDAASLESAFDGIDVVYYLVHSMGSAKDFAAQERRRRRTSRLRPGARACIASSTWSGLHPEDRALSRIWLHAQRWERSSSIWDRDRRPTGRMVVGSARHPSK